MCSGDNNVQRQHSQASRQLSLSSQQHPSSRHQSTVQPPALLADQAGTGSGNDNDVILPADHDCRLCGCQRVIINVSGQRFETQLRTLNRYPGTLLGNPLERSKFWDSRRQEYFLDRHRPSFQAILYYYQSGGRLQRPVEVPEDIFLDELDFYRLDEEAVHDYKVREGLCLEEKSLELPEAPWQRTIWQLFEDPSRSIFSRVVAIIAVSFIVVSVVCLCLETLPSMTPQECVNITVPLPLPEHEGVYMDVIKQVINYREPFFIVESVCVSWFTLEYILRLISCPHKLTFIKNIMNIFDVLAILPYFIVLTMGLIAGSCDSGKKGSTYFVIVRVLRIVRIFKLSKHSQGLRILGLTIKASLRELSMFFFFLIIAMVIFSSAIYYAEMGEPKTQMTSIPGAFWWAIVTMATVGYGDVTPVGYWGKLVGTLCVIAGVLTVALPVPVVVTNFNNFYRR